MDTTTEIVSRRIVNRRVVSRRRRRPGTRIAFRR